MIVILKYNIHREQPIYRIERKSWKNAGTLTRTYHQLFSGKNTKGKSNHHKMWVLICSFAVNVLILSVISSFSIMYLREREGESEES